MTMAEQLQYNRALMDHKAKQKEAEKPGDKMMEKIS
jgi:hypothetical protein